MTTRTGTQVAGGTMTVREIIGRLFQTRGRAVEKDVPLTVDSLTVGSTN